jgi:hypothetical protein
VPHEEAWVFQHNPEIEHQGGKISGRNLYFGKEKILHDEMYQRNHP